MAVDDRHLDVWDILTKVTTGWVTPPTEPQIVLESRFQSLDAYINRGIDNGVIVIHRVYTFDREKHSRLYETREWAIPISIIAPQTTTEGQSLVLLQGIFDQCREVFDRYTSSPWATGTLGTGTTYTYTGIETANIRDFPQAAVMECQVILKEQFVSVVIA
jgi:hypothetical protein